MSTLNPSSRLKVKRDTFFLPDQNGGVYFRNNQSSFRMEGATIYQWIEKLLPMFTGKQTLAELTEGLTLPYRNRVYEIGETLYKNGFVRDLSEDKPHQLNESILEQYAPQIEFIENFVDSGTFRFQQYRQASVLAIGSGPFFLSLISSLLESGMEKFHFILTETTPTNRQRLNELIQKTENSENIFIEEIPYQKENMSNFFKEVIGPYDWILYTSQDGNILELSELNRACKETGKGFLPAICLEKVGLAGPLISPDSDCCWESAWRRLHHSVIEPDDPPKSFSSTAGAILANITVFELFKKVTGIGGANQNSQIYLLNLETLEGDWISFLAHPLVVDNHLMPRLVEDLDERLRVESEEKEDYGTLLNVFSALTSKETGILHTWEERDLTQLPLAQCMVQAVDPLSEGPANLLPEIICTGFTHDEAQREAGLKGIEMYVSKIIHSTRLRTIGSNEINFSGEFLGIGAGETFAEAVCRALQAYLEEELRNRQAEQQSTILRMKVGTLEDRRCRFYYNSLSALNGSPAIGTEKEILGFPVIGVRSDGRWYTSPGLNTTLALRNALSLAISAAQNKMCVREKQTEIFLKKGDSKFEIPSGEGISELQLLKTSNRILTRNNRRLLVYDLAFEPFLKQGLAGVYGVTVQEGGL